MYFIVKQNIHENLIRYSYDSYTINIKKATKNQVKTVQYSK
jgi:hypothetical protein